MLGGLVELPKHLRDMLVPKIGVGPINTKNPSMAYIGFKPPSYASKHPNIARVDSFMIPTPKLGVIGLNIGEMCIIWCVGPPSGLIHPKRQYQGPNGMITHYTRAIRCILPTLGLKHAWHGVDEP